MIDFFYLIIKFLYAKEIHQQQEHFLYSAEPTIVYNTLNIVHEGVLSFQRYSAQNKMYERALL